MHFSCLYYLIERKIMYTIDSLLKDLKKKDQYDTRSIGRVKSKPARDYKRNQKCHICNESFKLAPEMCDFHHINRENKNNELAILIKQFAFDSPEVKKELKKTIPLCSNCHRIVHFGNGTALLGRNK